MAVLSMSDGELRRLEVVRDIDRGGLPVGAAAQLLGRSERQVWRMVKAFRSAGVAGLVSKAEADARVDGIFVPQTNVGLEPLQTMLRYKQLWTIEAAFRTAKHLFATRPIYHKLDETTRSHVFCSFLALLLKSALDDRIAGFDQTKS